MSGCQRTSQLSCWALQPTTLPEGKSLGSSGARSFSKNKLCWVLSFLTLAEEDRGAFLSSVTPDRAALHLETCLLLRVLCPSCYYKLPGQLRGLQRTNVIAPFRADICRRSCGSKRGTESHPLKGSQSDSAQAHRGFRADGDSSGLRQYEEKGWVSMGWGGAYKEVLEVGS